MPSWNLTVDLAPYWGPNGSYTFEERRDKIVETIRKSRWSLISDDPRALEVLLDELADAKDAIEFDGVFGFVYDLADDDRVWIETF